MTKTSLKWDEGKYTSKIAQTPECGRHRQAYARAGTLLPNVWYSAPISTFPPENEQIEATMKELFNNSFLAILAALSLIVMSACDSDPASEDHPDVDRVQIESAGIVIVNASESTAFAPVLVARGVTLDLDIVFTDQDGILATHGDDEYVDFQIVNGTLARWEADDAKSFSGQLTGLAVGTTTIRIRLMHGEVGDSDSHADFTSAQITLNVVE